MTFSPQEVILQFVATKQGRLGRGPFFLVVNKSHGAALSEHGTILSGGA